MPLTAPVLECLRLFSEVGRIAGAAAALAKAKIELVNPEKSMLG